MKQRVLVVAGLLLANAIAHAAVSDNTASQYKPTNGPVGSVNGVVIQQSVDGYNSIPINSSHRLPVTCDNCSGGGGGSNQGTAAAASGAWPFYLTDLTFILGTPAHPVRTDPTGTTPQPVSQSGAPWSISLPTGASTAANQATANASLANIDASTALLAVSGGSTTSGQKGPLVQAAAVSGDQAYTAGQTNPLTMTTTGRLRVGLSSAGALSGGTAGTNSDAVGGIYNSTPLVLTNGQQASIQLDASGNVLVNDPGLPNALGQSTKSGSTSITLASDQGALNANLDNVTDGVLTTCTAAAAGDLTCTPVAAPFSTVGYAAVDVHVSSLSATSITPQTYFDGGTTAIATACRVLTSSLSNVASIIATGAYECQAGSAFKLTQVGAGSSTAKVTLKRNVGPPLFALWASGSTNSANGLQVGGYDGSVFRKFLTDTFGSQFVLGAAADNADGVATIATGVLRTAAENYVYNGTSMDRWKSGGVTGMAGVVLQATPSGGASFTHIAAGQATTTVKSGAGTLYQICYNGAATATNVTTVYDNTAGSGAVIAIPAVTSVTSPLCQPFGGSVGLTFTLGLTIVTATANGADMTVTYK